VSHTALIRFARIYNSDLVAGPVRYSGTVYGRDGLRWLPKETDVPLVVDHDMGREIGRVMSLHALQWVDGRWWTAHVTVTDRPPWLKRGTGASFEYKALDKMDINGWSYVRNAIVCEVTVTSPDCEPRDPGARVLTLHPAETVRSSKPSPTATSDRAGGEVFYGGPVIRRPIGQVLGVR
jgi:hypothetical protein